MRVGQPQTVLPTEPAGFWGVCYIILVLYFQCTFLNTEFSTIFSPLRCLGESSFTPETAPVLNRLQLGSCYSVTPVPNINLQTLSPSLLPLLEKQLDYPTSKRPYLEDQTASPTTTPPFETKPQTQTRQQP